MTISLLLAAICLAADAPAAPVAFEFKDSATYENRPVLQYRALEFRPSPVRPLGDDRTFDKDALYGVVPVGPKPETALTIVWLPKAAGGPELWLDANGDGKLTDDKRRVMTGRDIEIPATITIQREPELKVNRTLLFRRSTLGDGLRYAVRGYMQGRLNLGGTEYSTLLIDGNANGCFDTVGQDRVWIDLNQDGRFDPLTEQFPLGKPISHKGEVYVVRSDAAASAVVANLRSVGQGKLRLTLAKPLSPAPKISAELVSDLGELVSIDKLDEAAAVPFGDYHLSSLKLEAPDAKGQTWTYNFYNDKAKNYPVPTNQETTITLLGQLDMTVSLDEYRLKQERVSAGQTVSIQPKLTADGSLYLHSCTMGRQGDASPIRAEGNAEILLLAPNGETVARGLTGFS